MPTAPRAARPHAALSFIERHPTHALLLAAVLLLCLGAMTTPSPPTTSSAPGPSWHIVRLAEGGQFWQSASRRACEAAEGEDGVLCVRDAADEAR